jgi:hypothetical protein
MTATPWHKGARGSSTNRRRELREFSGGNRELPSRVNPTLWRVDDPQESPAVSRREKDASISQMGQDRFDFADGKTERGAGCEEGASTRRIVRSYRRAPGGSGWLWESHGRTAAGSASSHW